MVSCNEQERLLAAYQSAAEAFAAAVAQLRARMGTSSLTEYHQLQRATDDARLVSEHARLAYEQHVASHRD